MEVLTCIRWGHSLPFVEIVAFSSCVFSVLIQEAEGISAFNVALFKKVEFWSWLKVTIILSSWLSDTETRFYEKYPVVEGLTISDEVGVRFSWLTSAFQLTELEVGTLVIAVRLVFFQIRSRGFLV